ncbi:MAG: cupin domain-containing protein [Burkholderiales bacterium]
MQPLVLRGDAQGEFMTEERCSIRELANLAADPGVSIAQARVRPGVVTRWHRLRGTVERYVILAGRGRVEVGDLPPTDVGPGDVVLIPADVRQRIANMADRDLVFLAICSPRFVPAAYEDVDPAPDGA